MKPADEAALARLLAAHPLLQAEFDKRARSKFRTYFQDTGPLRRELYIPHTLFMAAGAIHRERAFIAANRIGKTETAAFEIGGCHLTGLYPAWWEGYRYPKANRWWAAGDTMQTTRDIIQVSLMGPHDGVPRQEWAGMIPAHLVHHTTRRTGGVANCLEYVYVKHHDASGKPDGISSLQFKSYDQGRRSFQGTEIDGAWIDEEPPDMVDEQTGDIYTEILLRTMTTGGLVIGTFTPLRGLTPFIQRYLEDAVCPDRCGGEMPAMQYFWPEGLPGEDEKGAA